jgi:beta-ureidopropionase
VKIKICGLQPGTFQPGDTSESYVNKQIELLRTAVASEEKSESGKPYICAFPETMTYAYIGGVANKKWFDLAESAQDGPVTTKMIAEAKQLGVHIVYTLFEKAVEHGSVHYYNSSCIVSPTRGLIGVYRKCHIPSILDKPGVLECHETFYYEGGNVLPVFRLDNRVLVGILICYDRSFAAAWNTLYMQGAQIIFVPTCTWGYRYPLFQAELQVRAMETHTFVLGLNRCGNETIEGETQERYHFGHSIIAGPMGDVITKLTDEQWTYLAAEIELDEIEEAHTFMDFKGARRPELYGAVVAKGSFGGPYIHRHNGI